MRTLDRHCEFSPARCPTAAMKIESAVGSFGSTGTTVSVEIVKGASTRTKTVSVAGDPGVLADRIAQWMGKHV